MSISLPLMDINLVALIKVLIFVGFIVASIVSQIAKSIQQANRKAAASPKTAQSPRPTAVDREIADFLGKGKTKSSTSARPPRPPGARSSGKPGPGKPRRGPGDRTVVAGQRVRDNPPSPPSASANRERDSVTAGRSVAQHVEQHLTRGGLGQRNSHLAESVEQSDERLEGHLHQVFDHRLGSLNAGPVTAIAEGTDATSWQSANAPLPLASQIHELLASPHTVASALVLSEILRRPGDAHGVRS